MKLKKIGSFLLIVLVVLLLAINFQHDQKNHEVYKTEPESFQGTYQINHEKKEEEYTNKTTLDARKVKKVTFKGHFVKEVPQGMNLMMYLYRMKVTMYQNGEIIYQQGSKHSKDNIRPFGTRWGSVESKGIKTGDDILIVMEQTSPTVYRGAYDAFFQTMRVGTQYELLGEQVSKHMGKIIVAIVIFIIGLALLVVNQSIYFMSVSLKGGYTACALFLVSGAICSFIDYDYITLIFSNADFVHLIDILSQIAICGFLMLYLNYFIQTKKFRRITNGLIGIWTGLNMVYIVAQTIGVVPPEKIINYMIVIFIPMIVTECAFIVHDLAEYKKGRSYVIGSSIGVVIFIVAEMVHYCIKGVFWISLFQAGLLIFTLVQFYVLMKSTRYHILKAERSGELEQELAENRVKIMLSQIQPHFLYNALSSIAGLCDLDAKKAKSAIVRFSDYLRGNMDSLKTRNNVLFVRELEHLKTYLELEQMRFGDELQVEWKIQVTDFELPALTVQPLVENAVKYGIGEKENGGIVTISTQEKEAEIQIVIDDDGVGYDVHEVKSDGRTHIGIENVRTRLKEQCGGTLEIQSQMGKGTTAIIRIPKEVGNENISSR